MYQCKHLQNLECDSPRDGAWYNHLCKANPFPIETDPYDGVEKPVTRGVNGFGKAYAFPAPHRYAYCRDINRGICPWYEVSSPLPLERMKGANR